MKVIVAGYSKTGTKTLHAALEKLGYNVYDFVENFIFLGDDWIKIFNGQGTVEDFKRMYKDVDATCDLPAFVFWEEIHQAFPDAKIILTVRDEDSWFPSFAHQIKSGHANIYLTMLFLFSPTVWRISGTCLKSVQHVYGAVGPIWNTKINEMYTRMSFRRHNAHVLSRAPKDKLLVYSVKEGWGPLCQFLNLQEPDAEFPHKNKGSSLFEDLFASSDVLIKLKHESMLVAGGIALATTLGSALALAYTYTDFSLF